MELTELEKKILDSKMRELEDTIIVKTLDKIAEKIAEDLYVPVYQKLITKVAENYNQQIKTSATPKTKDFCLPDLPKMPSDLDSTITKPQFRTIDTNNSANGINTIRDEFNNGNSCNTTEFVKQQCNMNSDNFSSSILDKQQNTAEESSKIKEALRPVKQPELDNTESERTNNANFKKIFDYLTPKKSDMTESSTESIHKKNNIDNNQYNQRNKSKTNNENEQSMSTQTTQHQHQSKSQSNDSSEKKNLVDKDKQRQEAKEKINNIINALFSNSMYNNDKISSNDILTPDEIEALLQLKFPQNMVEDFDRIFCDFFNITPNKKQ